MENEEIQKELQEKWDELCDRDEDPFDDWQEYLSQAGCVDQITVQCHWGEGGVLELVDKLIEMLNQQKRVRILEDPSKEGMDCWGYLIFPG